MQVCSIICCQAWEYTLVEINALGNWQRWRRWPTLSVLRAVWGSNDPRAYSIPDYHSRQCTFLFFIAVMSLAWILTVFFLCVWKLTVRLKFVIGSDEMWKHMIKHGAPVPWIQASKQQTNYVTDSEGICNVHSSALNALCGSFLVGGNAKLPISSLPRLIINILSLTITTLIIIITKRYILIYWMIY